MNKIINNVFSLRYFALLAVISPFAGAMLMLFLGAKDTIEAYLIFFGAKEHDGVTSSGEAAMIQLVASIDHFLFAAILMIFAIGLYALFFKSYSERDESGKRANTPSWKQLKNMGGMDEMLLKVIIMLLAVSFLEYVLTAGIGMLNWVVLVIPLTIIALAIGLRWMSETEEDEKKDRLSTEEESHHSGYLDELERLADLHEKNAITDGEFENMKKYLFKFSEET